MIAAEAADFYGLMYKLVEIGKPVRTHQLISFIK